MVFGRLGGLLVGGGGGEGDDVCFFEGVDLSVEVFGYAVDGAEVGCLG